MASVINYKVTDGNFLGAPALTVSGDTTTLGAPRLALGTIVRGNDATYGEGEFRYVKFTGTVAAGDFVAVDDTAFTAVGATTSTTKGAIGIAMAAQATGQYGYVMIRGTHDAANVATGVTAGTPLYLTATAGRPNGTVVTGNKIDGAFERSITSASNVGTVECVWPSWTGNG